MFNAVETKNEISFRQIYKPSGRRINYTKAVAGIGEIQNADIVKGYEVGQDQYVTMTTDEIDALILEQAIGEEGGAVRVHRQDGQFAEERTFPRSRDPRRSPG